MCTNHLRLNVIAVAVNRAKKRAATLDKKKRSDYGKL